jgi:pimeloyl-ACP methyl ester carboxylesterase
VRIAILAFLYVLVLVAPALAEERVTIPTRPGVTQSFYLTKPEGPPAASLILFTGGFGTLDKYGPADLRHGNFLVRSRGLFVAQGFIVAVMDVPSDESSLSDDFRFGSAHRSDIAAVIAHLRQLANVPVWLIGTSRGTLSAANAATLPSGGADGVVLTSSILRSGGKHGFPTLFEAGLGNVAIPTLMVHNRDDGCQACPFRYAADLLERVTHAPRKELISFAGGDPPVTEPCEALSRHGYLGIEEKVVAAIAGWIKAK